MKPFVELNTRVDKKG